MGDSETVNREVFEAYQFELKKVAELIKPELPVAGDDDHLDGREWCEANDIPQSVFADAVNYHLDEADYGVSPMYPWKYEE